MGVIRELYREWSERREESLRRRFKRKKDPILMAKNKYLFRVLLGVAAVGWVFPLIVKFSFGSSPYFKRMTEDEKKRELAMMLQRGEKYRISVECDEEEGLAPRLVDPLKKKEKIQPPPIRDDEYNLQIEQECFVDSV